MRPAADFEGLIHEDTYSSLVPESSLLVSFAFMEPLCIYGLVPWTGPKCGQRPILREVHVIEGGFASIQLTSGLFHVWRIHGITGPTQLLACVFGSLGCALLCLFAGWFHFHRRPKLRRSAPTCQALQASTPS